MQIQICQLLKKPTDLDLHCLQRLGISGSTRTRVKLPHKLKESDNAQFRIKCVVVFDLFLQNIRCIKSFAIGDISTLIPFAVLPILHMAWHFMHYHWLLEVQLNFNCSNIFGTIEICFSHGLFKPLSVYHSVRSGGKWWIIKGCLLDLL